jgi:hypothetical protein
LTATDLYYEVSWRDSGDGTRVARPIDHDRSVARRLLLPGFVKPEPDLTWTWQNAEHRPDDIAAAVDGVRLVSPLVRQIFDEHRTPNDIIQWIPGTVIDSSGIRLPYWVPHFPVHEDLIDAAHTTFGPGEVPIRYSLSLKKLAPHAVTIISGRPLGFVLSQPVVDALRAADAKGIRIMAAPVS